MRSKVRSLKRHCGAAGSSAATHTIGRRWPPGPKFTRCSNVWSRWGADVPAIGQRIAVDGSGVRNMPLLNLMVPLIVIGLVLWLINRYIPMASSIKTILNVVVVLIVWVWVLQAMGLWVPVSTSPLHVR